MMIKEPKTMEQKSAAQRQTQVFIRTGFVIKGSTQMHEGRTDLVNSLKMKDAGKGNGCLLNTKYKDSL